MKLFVIRVMKARDGILITLACAAMKCPERPQKFVSQPERNHEKNNQQNLGHKPAATLEMISSHINHVKKESR
jgi:hypothetical protein